MVEFKLSPWKAYHTPCPRSSCLTLDFFCLPSTLLCFCLSSPVLGFTSICCSSLRLALSWPRFWIGPGRWAALCDSSPGLAPTPHSLRGCVLQFSAEPRGLLALALRPSVARAALHPGADLDVPLIPSFPYQPLFSSSWSNFPPFPPNPTHGLGQARLWRCWW